MIQIVTWMCVMEEDCATKSATDTCVNALIITEGNTVNSVSLIYSTSVLVILNKTEQLFIPEHAGLI